MIMSLSSVVKCDPIALYMSSAVPFVAASSQTLSIAFMQGTPLFVKQSSISLYFSLGLLARSYVIRYIIGFYSFLFSWSWLLSVVSIGDSDEKRYSTGIRAYV